MRKLRIELKDNSYDIIIENNLFSNLNNYIKEVYNNDRIFIITDDNVEKLYLNKVINSLDGYKVDYVVVPHGEASKSLTTYAKVCEELINKKIKRNNLLIALGGGVIGDLTGFVASTLYRGLPYVGIPTSLLAQMDSSIGGKTGIDFNNMKNILGCFKQPKLVLIDPETLKTLDKREFNNGMGELIKHGAIGNLKLLEKLESKPEINEDIIYESLLVKKRVVELDPFDQKERMTLNFGHTFGHAIELKYNYKHGEAVAIGMLMALRLGIQLGVTEKEALPKLEKIIKLYGLPTTYYCYKDFLDDILFDKKNLAGVINFIFITKLGECVIYKIDEAKIKEVL